VTPEPQPTTDYPRLSRAMLKRPLRFILPVLIIAGLQWGLAATGKTAKSTQIGMPPIYWSEIRNFRGFVTLIWDLVRVFFFFRLNVMCMLTKKDEDSSPSMRATRRRQRRLVATFGQYLGSSRARTASMSFTSSSETGRAIVTGSTAFWHSSAGPLTTTSTSVALFVCIFFFNDPVLTRWIARHTRCRDGRFGCP
jgi:hypothetical protein